MNKEEFLSRMKNPEKFKAELQTLAIADLHEFTNLLYDSAITVDTYSGDTLVTFDMIDYAINLYIDILETSAKKALECVKKERKWQMENK